MRISILESSIDVRGVRIRISIKKQFYRRERGKNKDQYMRQFYRRERGKNADQYIREFYRRERGKDNDQYIR
jgi:hypothetical protein